MAGKRKPKKRPRKTNKRGWWSALDSARRRRLLTAGAIAVAMLAGVFAGAVGVTRLEAHVDRLILTERPDATFEFTDLPRQIIGLADGDLDRALHGLRARDWTDDRLCEEIAGQLATVGWVAGVERVRRMADGRFEISARYREPFALVHQGTEFVLVDCDGVRLPGTYANDPSWQIIQGVATPAPRAGATWDGKDLTAGIAVLKAIAREPFADQITAVLVDNFEGRRDRRTCHIELATDRAGGRIRWGSAPGLELEENLPEQKLALLRQNYAKTGRADAGHAVIDVSTFSDRYTIPG